MARCKPWFYAAASWRCSRERATRVANGSQRRLYQVAPISTNLILAYIAEHILGLPRSFWVNWYSRRWKPWFYAAASGAVPANGRLASLTGHSAASIKWHRYRPTSSWHM